MMTIEFYRPDRIYGGLKRHVSTVESGVSPQKAKQLIKFAYPDATKIRIVYGTKSGNAHNQQNP